MKKNQNQKLQALQQILHQTQKEITRAQQTIAEILDDEESHKEKQTRKKTGDRKPEKVESEDIPYRVEKYPTGGEIIEGVFNGHEMIGPDGSSYPVPENYASKSKLVEGDLLKLTITPQGRFIYKQIGPTERETKRGVLIYKKGGDQYSVLVDGLEYKVLKASVTYYKGSPGDEVVILLPRGRTAVWAALDNIVYELPEREKSVGLLPTASPLATGKLDQLQEIEDGRRTAKWCGEVSDNQEEKERMVEELEEI